MDQYKTDSMNSDSMEIGDGPWSHAFEMATSQNMDIERKLLLTKLQQKAAQTSQIPLLGEIFLTIYTKCREAGQ